MPDENFIEVRLDVGVAKGFEVSVIQVLPVFAAAGQIEALVGMLFQEGRHIKLVFLLGDLGEAMPVKYTIKTNFVLSL